MTMLDPVAPYQTRYDRAAVTTGIVHIGYGAFHRGHQAVFLDDYMQASGDLTWGIAAINLRAEDSTSFGAMRADKSPDDQGYLLKTIAPDGDTALRMVRPHIAFTDWPSDRAGAEAWLTQSTVHALSLTVTESGYYLSTDWSLNTADPVIAAEIQGGLPTSVYGFMAAALGQRASSIDLPITVLCCDNIRENGRVLEAAFLTYLQACGHHALADWVRKSVSFPCSMVDRITPRTTEALQAEIGAMFPGQNLDPIHAEQFTQWVIEDRFAGPMPDLARVGVEIVRDVHPFEETKIRILNGGHTGLAYLGALAGHQTFDQAIDNPDLRAHFDEWERGEVLPGLTLDLPFDKGDYLDQITARFRNAAIADQLERICMDGYSKMPIYVSPTIDSCLSQGIDPVAGYRVIASWYVFARRSSSGTCQVRYFEPFWNDLAPLLAPSQQTAFASAPQLWGDMPTRYPGFVPGVAKAIQEVETRWPT